MILTFQCTKRVETVDDIEVTLTRTLWSVPAGEDDDEGNPKYELCDWTMPGAEPFCVDGSMTFNNNDDEYEVGRHYGFTSDGPIDLPEDDTEYDG